MKHDLQSTRILPQLLQPFLYLNFNYVDFKLHIANEICSEVWHRNLRLVHALHAFVAKNGDI